MMLWPTLSESGSSGRRTAGVKGMSYQKSALSCTTETLIFRCQTQPGRERFGFTITLCTFCTLNACPTHHGVNWQAIRYTYEFAQPKSNATQLVPRYGSTNPAPSSTNICYGPVGCDDAGNNSCVELRIAPGSVVVTDSRWVDAAMQA